jgi:hypothetical protein
VISANGLLSSLWVSQHKDESNPFLFATKIYPSRNFRTKPNVKWAAMDLIDLTVGQLKRATAIKERIEALNKELRSILGETADAGTAPRRGRGRGVATKAAARTGRRRKKVFSAATRAKLSARLKAYWAAKRAGKK